MQQTLIKNMERHRALAQPETRFSLRERLLIRALKGLNAGRLCLQFPSGRRAVFEASTDGPDAFVRINDMRVIRRLLLAGDLGFAEGYVKGEWETPDLTEVLRFGALNNAVFKRNLEPNALVKMFLRAYHARRQNSRRGSRRNIAAHYDLGNAFYEKWLDRTMSYSAAIFETPAENMESAQHRKYRRMAKSIDLGPGDRVLEIGCGWGGFAEIAAAEFGCKVTCLTLSREQAAYAQARMAEKGLAEQVDVRLQDYRDVDGQFDKIVSIEMFEAVGEAYWATYLEILRQRLKPGGKAALQIITIDETAFEDYRRNPDFIQRHIFPGGMLPSPAAFAAAVSDAGLAITDAFYFGASYAETVRRWQQDFQLNWPDIKGLGFDDAFFRLWCYYLSYCEAGFDCGTIDVGQFVIEAR